MGSQPPATTPAHRVLVVDDESSITELVATVLRYEGFQVKTAANGRKALAAVTSFRPHLEWPLRWIVVNLSPGTLRKEGPGLDLPVAMGGGGAGG